jgi:hypothetical protein
MRPPLSYKKGAWEEQSMQEDPELGEALDNLRDAIFHAYAVFVRKERRAGPAGVRKLGDDGKLTAPPTEHERRKDSLDFLRGEILEERPLETFSALHLELLELMVAYWRELEEAPEA